MASIIEQAIKGQRTALNSLYEENKQKVYYLALCLLKNPAQAQAAMVTAFRESLNGMQAAQIRTAQQFTEHIVCKTVNYCKAKLYQKNPKSLRVPFNKDFSIPSNAMVRDQYDTALAYYLGNLPTTQRYIFAMHTIGELDALHICRILKFDAKTVRMAIDAEADNWNRLRKLSIRDYADSWDGLLQTAKEAEADIVVPEAAEQQVAAIINSIAAPIEEKERNSRYKRTVFSVLLLACALILALIIGLSSGNDIADTDETQGTTQNTETAGGTEATETEPAYDALDETLVYYADIVIQDYGTITVQLDQHSAPITCANFVELAESGFYDGLTFHRIIEGTMMQGGCPEGTGYGSSDNTIVGEFSANGYDNPLSHTRGAISMARSDDYDSASCQFFIVQQDYTSWDGQYAVFGYVIDGMDVVDAVCADAQPTDSNGSMEAENQPVITSVTIRTAATE